MPSLSGHLLVAAPKLGDPNFARTVILIVQHGDEGAFGLVLNQPSGQRVKDLWDQVASGECQLEGPLCIGGPVEGPLLAVHADAALSEREIVPGVYFASQRDSIEQLIEHPAGPARMFLGYSGWGEGQLEGELQEGAWLTVPATAEHVFFDGDDLWKQVVSQISGVVIHSRGDIKHVPPQPWHN